MATWPGHAGHVGRPRMTLPRSTAARSTNFSNPRTSLAAGCRGRKDVLTHSSRRLRTAAADGRPRRSQHDGWSAGREIISHTTLLRQPWISKQYFHG